MKAKLSPGEAVKKLVEKGLKTISQHGTTKVSQLKRFWKIIKKKLCLKYHTKFLSNLFLNRILRPILYEHPVNFNWNLDDSGECILIEISA